MECNGSILLQADLSFSERDNTTREEGNAAHWLASVVFTGETTAVAMIDKKAPNGIFITADIAEHVTDYVNAVDRWPDALHFNSFEWPYQLYGQNWQLNGRADHIEFAGDTLYVDDFKYGYTIVEPEHNWTLIAHAVGWCVENDIAPERIVFVIHQPRAPHHEGRVREWSIGYQHLLELYGKMNAVLSDPSDVTQTGPHCYRCPSFTSCEARQVAELSAVEVACMAYNASINNDDLAARLDLIARAKKLLDQSEKAYLELGTHRVEKGEIVKNYSMKIEQTNRVWNDGITPEIMQALIGRDISSRKLPTPRQAEQAGLTSDFVNLLSDRRDKGKKLVRIDANKKASKMFGSK
jgi:hypothetical protein